MLTPAVMEILEELLNTNPDSSFSLSAALTRLTARERYLAYEMTGQRYDLGSQYGLFMAQFALAMSGSDREEVLSQMLEVMALRETESDRPGDR